MTNPSPVFRSGNEPDWLKSSFSQKLFSALGSQNIRFVGGAVRDSLLGASVSDVDMATTHTPETVMLKLKAEGVKVIPTGVAHGTVTAVYAGEAREITTLRVDIETDGRRAAVAFTDDWTEDAARRDFTINALYLDSEGRLYDAFGGLDDLKARRVRFIGDANKRIEEDGLRILRFYRFSSFYAEHVDSDGQKACAENRHMIGSLSVERVREELLKLMAGKDPSSALVAMADAGVLQCIFGAKHNMQGLQDQIAFDQQSKVATSALTRLWLISGKQYCVKHFARRFKLSGAQKKCLIQLEEAMTVEDEKSVTLAHKLLYLYGPIVAKDAVQLQHDLTVAAILQKEIQNWSVPRFPMSAKDLLAMGYTAGPELGQTMNKLKSIWMENDFSITKQALLKLATTNNQG